MLHKVKDEKGKDEDEDEDMGGIFRFGTQAKTRYELFHICLNLMTDKGFELLTDADAADLIQLHSLMQKIANEKNIVFELPINLT